MKVGGFAAEPLWQLRNLDKSRDAFQPKDRLVLR